MLVLVPSLNGVNFRLMRLKSKSTCYLQFYSFSRTFAPLMAEQKKGTIVNVSSLATLYPLPFMPSTMRESQLFLPFLNR